MSYTPGLPTSHWHSIDTLGTIARLGDAGITEAAWPTADLAIYVPVEVPRRVVLVSLWYGNGSGTAGNYDIGLYDFDGAKILSRGSTAKSSGSEAEIVWDCTNTTIGPGIYYLALVASSAVDAYFRRTPAAPLAAAVGCFTQTSALPLPTTATFAVPQTLTYIPVIGMFFNTLVT